MTDSRPSRRNFLGVAAAVAGSVITTSTVTSGTAAPAGDRHPRRDVQVASINMFDLKGYDPEKTCRRVLERMNEILPLKPDIICTPELFPFWGQGRANVPPLSECAEDRTGPVLSRFADFARSNGCYIICSTYTKEGDRYYVAAVLLDREGRYAGEYRCINPDESQLAQGITPAPLDPPVFETDFGIIGMQICYDINWYDNWTRLGRKGARIVFWPSAYGGGMMLNSLAWMNHYYVVSSARYAHPTKIINPLGVDVAETGHAGHWSGYWVCEPLNMDFAVVQGVVHFQKFQDIRKKYVRQFQFRILQTEALALVQAVSGDVSVADMLREFEIPTAQEAWQTATQLQNAKRINRK